MEPVQADSVPGGSREVRDGEALSISSHCMVLHIRTSLCICDLDQEGLEAPVRGPPGQLKAVPGHIADGETGHNWLLLLWVMMEHQRWVTEAIQPM